MTSHTVPSDQDWSQNPDHKHPGAAAGRSLSPRRDDRRRHSPARGGDDSDRGRSSGSMNPGNNLHISGIASGCEEQDLEDLFSKYGRVIKCHIMREPQTREVRGFGFVTMDTAEEANAAMSSLNATDFMGKLLSVEKARRGRGRTPTPGQYLGPQRSDDRRRYADDRRYQDRRGGGRREDYGRRDYGRYDDERRDDGYDRRDYRGDRRRSDDRDRDYGRSDRRDGGRSDRY